MFYYIDLKSTDARYNMAFELWCLNNLPKGHTYFYLWRNAPSVIIGENQNAQSEVNLNYLKENGIMLARRTTGGGAVYHDLNNLNYSFIGENVSPQPMVEVLKSLGVQAYLNGRNDIFVDGCKVSGYARRWENNRELVHGTLLYDVDLSVLTKALDTPYSKLHAKGVESVRSRVTNLKDYVKAPDIESFILDVKAALFNLILNTSISSASQLGKIQNYELSEAQLAQIQELYLSKFATDEWNLKI